MPTLAHREECVGRAPRRALLWREGGGKHLIEERGRRNWTRAVWAEGNGLASEERHERNEGASHWEGTSRERLARDTPTL